MASFFVLYVKLKIRLFELLKVLIFGPFQNSTHKNTHQIHVRFVQFTENLNLQFSVPFLSFISLHSSVFFHQSSSSFPFISLHSWFSIQIMRVRFPHSPEEAFSLQYSSERSSWHEVEWWQNYSWHDNTHQQKCVVNHSIHFFEKALEYENG